MTKEEKERYDEPELLGDILKRVLAGKSRPVFKYPLPDDHSEPVEDTAHYAGLRAGSDAFGLARLTSGQGDGKLLF